jgi:hypothetical protein
VTRLEDLTKGTLVSGVLGDRTVKVVDVAWHGSNAVTLTYTDEPTGKVDQELLYRDDEPRLRVEHAGRAWSMDADGSLFRLVSEAKRISLAYLFDPFLAVHTSDLMRRLVKERLLKFDGTPLFPERRAYSPTYPLSDQEALLYKLVTEYVNEEMNRADRLKREGEGRRGTVVGFALTTLQRRLASSPEVIYQSLVRRRKRLVDRVAQERMQRRGAEVAATLGVPDVPDEFRDDEDFDVDDLPDRELEDLEEELVDQASTTCVMKSRASSVSQKRISLCSTREAARPPAGHARSFRCRAPI